MGGLRPDEEPWRGPYDNLCERFPTAGADRVAESLRQHGGHAGKAASSLRELLSATVREPDPDDAEHVKTLLSSPFMFKHSCREHFERFDLDGSGSLDLEEVTQLAKALYSSFGLPPPSEGSVRAFFVEMDKNGDGVLSEHEFQTFFEMFLRLAYFNVKKLKNLVERGSAKASGAGVEASASEDEEARKADKAGERADRRRRRKAHHSGTPTGAHDSSHRQRGSSTPAGRSRGHRQRNDTGSPAAGRDRSGTPASYRGGSRHSSDEDRPHETPSCSRAQQRSRHGDGDWKAESFKPTASFKGLATPLGAAPLGAAAFRKGADFGAGSTCRMWPA